MAAGSEYMSKDPTVIEELCQIRVDEWSTPENIEEERNRLLELTVTATDFAKLDEALRERAHSTDAMLRELVAEIKHVADTGAERTLHTYTEARALKAEAMLYKNACIKLRSEVMSKAVELVCCEAQNRKLQRNLERLSGSNSQPAKRLKVSDEAPSLAPDTLSMMNGEGNSQQVQEFRRYIQQLEQRLNETIANAPLVTEKLEQREIDIQREQRLRHGLEQRLNVLEHDAEQLRVQTRSKFTEVEQFRATMEGITQKAVDAAAEKLRFAELEMSRLQSKLAEADVLKTKVSGLEEQVREWTELHAQCEQRFSRVQENNKVARNTISGLNAALEESRTRERQLSAQIHSLSTVDGDHKLETQEALSKASASMDQLLTHTQNELRESQAQVEQLLSELDDVFADQRILRDKQKSLLDQIAEIETKHTVCMKELSNKDLKIHSVEKRNQELGNRFKALKGLLEREQSLKEQHVVHEQEMMQEMLQQKDTLVAMQREMHTLQQNESIAKMYVESTVTQNRALRQQVDALVLRCEELTSTLAKVKEERVNEPQNDTPSKVANPNGDIVDSNDAQLLERLRAIVKCSVCSTEFKNRIISRCGHMFCDKCVDRELKSRNRKCPQCKISFHGNDVIQAFLR